MMIVFSCALVFFSACATSSAQNANSNKINKFKTECEKNNAEACYEVGMDFLDKALNNAFENMDELAFNQSQKYLLKSCNLNYGDGCAAYAYYTMFQAMEKFFAENKNTSNSDKEKLLKKFKQKHSNLLNTCAKYAKKACDLNSAGGCSELSAAYFYGEGVKKDEKLGILYQKKACDLLKSHNDFMFAEIANNCLHLGTSYYIGRGITQNKQTALQYYLKGCKIGTKCDLVIENFMNGYKGKITIPQDYHFAFELAKAACKFVGSDENWDFGGGQSCNYLGILYYEGKGTTRDYNKAFEIFKKQCNDSGKLVKLGDIAIEGKAQGCGILAMLYEKGNGTTQNYFKAFEIYKNLCEAEFGVACGNVGYYYFNALGIRQDYRKAMEYFGKACDLGEQTGCDNHKMMKQTPFTYGLSKEDFE